jgi:hypothetical protein
LSAAGHQHVPDYRGATSNIATERSVWSSLPLFIASGAFLR